MFTVDHRKCLFQTITAKNLQSEAGYFCDAYMYIREKPLDGFRDRFCPDSKMADDKCKRTNNGSTAKQ